MIKLKPSNGTKTTSSKPSGNSNPAPKAQSTNNANQSSKKTNLVYDSSRYKDNYDDRSNGLRAKDAMQLIQNEDVFNIFSNTVMNNYDYRTESIRGIQNVADGGRYNIKVDTDGDGNFEEMSAAEAMADSFDSELDLWIENKVIEVINSVKHNTNLGIDIEKGLFSDEVLDKLASEGISVEKLNDHTFVFSLIDKEGNVLEDDNGGKGSIIFGDWAIPDGNFSASEQNMSSLLDVMGYDCVSRADFIGHEQDYLNLLEQVQENLDNGAYSSSGRNTRDMYSGITKSNIRTALTEDLMGTDAGNSGITNGIDVIGEMVSQAGSTLASKFEAAVSENVTAQRIRTAYQEVKNSDSTITEEEAVDKVALQLNVTTKEVQDAIK